MSAMWINCVFILNAKTNYTPMQRAAIIVRWTLYTLYIPWRNCWGQAKELGGSRCHHGHIPWMLNPQTVARAYTHRWSKRCPGQMWSTQSTRPAGCQSVQLMSTLFQCSLVTLEDVQSWVLPISLAIPCCCQGWFYDSMLSQHRFLVWLHGFRLIATLLQVHGWLNSISESSFRWRNGYGDLMRLHDDLIVLKILSWSTQ